MATVIITVILTLAILFSIGLLQQHHIKTGGLPLGSKSPKSVKDASDMALKQAFMNGVRDKRVHMGLADRKRPCAGTVLYEAETLAAMLFSDPDDIKEYKMLYWTGYSSI